mmetsp:Transcript_16084/g.24248  ORF Transcript_16084/g.24248 Transcript_16084/m.24248 type:complete len:379 (+) Transcript_16084:3-1139(+)
MGRGGQCGGALAVLSAVFVLIYPQSSTFEQKKCGGMARIMQSRSITPRIKFFPERSTIYGSMSTMRVLAKRGRKKLIEQEAPPAPEITDEQQRELEEEMKAALEAEKEVEDPQLDPFLTIYPNLSPKEKGHHLTPEDLWDPGIYKIPEWNNEIIPEYSAQVDCENFDVNYVRGRVRGNDTHPRLWWQNSGYIVVINMLAEGFDPRPWENNHSKEFGYQKQRGWLCVQERDDTNATRLVGFECIRDARRVREIVSRNYYDRLRQPFLEYISPEEFMKGACEGSNGKVTVVQTPLFYAYGSIELEEVVTKILEHPRDQVNKIKIRNPLHDKEIDPWDLQTPWEDHVRSYKEYLEWAQRFKDDNLKSLHDVLDEERNVGGT